MLWDLAIAGGGPAGLATAIAARQHGLSAVVFDQRPLPADKACGEGLMPPGVSALAALGVDIPVSECAPFEGIRYVDGAVIAEGRFSRPGLGIRRTVLARALLERAHGLGAEIHDACAVHGFHERSDRVTLDTARGAIDARVLVGADGLHSRVRRDAGIAVRSGGRVRFGVRRHFRVAPAAPFVEVHWQPEVEAYVTPVSADEVGVAMLYPGDKRRFDDLLALFPALAARLSGATVSSDARGAGPFRQQVRARSKGRVVLIGDAAGYLDALTGEGITLALRCALRLAEIVARREALAAYESAYRAESRAYYTLTELLLRIAARPKLRARLVRALAQNPQAFDRMLAANTGEVPLWSMGRSSAQLLLAMAR